MNHKFTFNGKSYEMPPINKEGYLHTTFNQGSVEMCAKLIESIAVRMQGNTFVEYDDFRIDDILKNISLVETVFEKLKDDIAKHQANN